MRSIEQRTIQAFEFEVPSPSGKENAVIIVEWSRDKLRARAKAELGYCNYDVWIRPVEGAITYYAFSDTANLPGVPSVMLPDLLAEHITSEPTNQILQQKIVEAESLHFRLEAQEERWLR